MPHQRVVLAAVSFLAAAVAQPGWALDYQVHGSLAQGFILSEGNDFWGDSTGGSFEYYEGALNGTVKPLSQLLISAQVVARDAGQTDDGKPRLDFAFADYTFVSGSASSAGLRAGRVKNAYGLYNDSRDVVFTRPSILLPSTYSEATGARALLFSVDGVQPYGTLTLGDHYLSAVGTWAPDSRLGGAEAKRLGVTGDAHLKHFYTAKLQDDWGAFSGALSYVHGLLDLSAPFPIAFTFDLYVLSARYNTRRFSLTSEYELTDAKGTFGSSFTFATKSDGAYLQGDYFLSPEWTLMARWDSSFTDRNDRSGTNSPSTCATNASTGVTDRHNCFAHDFTLGANWKSSAHWGIWGEYHLIDGLATASTRDNTPPAPNDPHWSMLLLMAAYRF